MTIFIVAIAAIAMMAFPQTSPVHPATGALLTGSSVEGVECRPGPKSGSVLDRPSPSRAGNFSLKGEYECRKSVFSAGERDVFIEKLVRAESIKAKRAAAEVKRQLGSRSHQASASAPLKVSVKGVDDPEIVDLLSTVYRTELTKMLQVGGVSHMQAADDLNDEENSVLSIQVRRVDSPELMTKLRLLIVSKKGNKQEKLWRDI